MKVLLDANVCITALRSTKLPVLLNDVLIALSARRAGAQVVTYNARDFRLIKRHVDFALRVVENPS